MKHKSTIHNKPIEQHVNDLLTEQTKTRRQTFVKALMLSFGAALAYSSRIALLSQDEFAWLSPERSKFVLCLGMFILGLVTALSKKIRFTLAL